MRADLNKSHVPTAADAARWFALATVAMQIATGASKAWHELAALREPCVGRGVVVFGRLTPENPCVLLLGAAALAAGSRTPHLYDDDLKAAAEGVIAAFYDWEAGLHG